jgi:hypothetical protein
MSVPEHGGPDRPSTDRRPKRRTRWIVAAGVSAGVAALVLAGVAVAGAARDRGVPDPQRRTEVAERGSDVMPFDLDRTTHRFAKNGRGGVQTVVADDPSDAAQVSLVRQHLRAEAARFAAGDFTDPARVHGDQMPGLAALRAAGGRVDVRLADLPAGASLTYTASEPALVSALHDWFDAQVSDHGGHAERG